MELLRFLLSMGLNFLITVGMFLLAATLFDGNNIAMCLAFVTPAIYALISTLLRRKRYKRIGLIKSK